MNIVITNRNTNDGISQNINTRNINFQKFNVKLSRNAKQEKNILKAFKQSEAFQVLDKKFNGTAIINVNKETDSFYGDMTTQTYRHCGFRPKIERFDTETTISVNNITLNNNVINKLKNVFANINIFKKQKQNNIFYSFERSDENYTNIDTIQKLKNLKFKDIEQNIKNIIE